jgi:hypothetical protein
MNAAPTLADCVAALEARRRAVCKQMDACGSPVAACDADFNALVLERAEITAAIARLSPIARGEAAVAHPLHDSTQ